jgi:hypothetical protein
MTTGNRAATDVWMAGIGLGPIIGDLTGERGDRPGTVATPPFGIKAFIIPNESSLILSPRHLPRRRPAAGVLNRF